MFVMPMPPTRSEMPAMMPPVSRVLRMLCSICPKLSSRVSKAKSSMPRWVCFRSPVTCWRVSLKVRDVGDLEVEAVELAIRALVDAADELRALELPKHGADRDDDREVFAIVEAEAAAGGDRRDGRLSDASVPFGGSLSRPSSRCRLFSSGS